MGKVIFVTVGEDSLTSFVARKNRKTENLIWTVDVAGRFVVDRHSIRSCCFSQREIFSILRPMRIEVVLSLSRLAFESC